MSPSARRNSQRGSRRFEAPRCQSNSQPNADAGAQPMTVGIIRVRARFRRIRPAGHPARRTVEQPSGTLPGGRFRPYPESKVQTLAGSGMRAGVDPQCYSLA